MAPNLFSPIKVGSVELKNRILMAPLTRVRAGLSHTPNELMKEYYAQRASAGLIIAECSMIAPNTSAFVTEPGLDNEEQLAAWKEVTDAVHAKGGKIFMQIWHAGRAAHPENNNGEDNVAPSAIGIDGHCLEDTIVHQFGSVAKNCVDVAGFDGVEIHGANGYLVEQFLRSKTNVRMDDYGGSPEKRTRFLTEVLQAVTDAIGADRTGIRFSPLSNEEDPLGHSGRVAKIAQELNLAYVHILRRDWTNSQTVDIEPVFREHFHNTLISNFGYTKDEANANIEAGKIDAVAFGVPFIANPDLPERFAQNAELNKPDQSTFYGDDGKGYTDYPFLNSA
ncbi:hypothetical protein Ae201684_005559 [Aphanomyces euteiches]|uniref:NADH:flavin oxidoreductase/NADH oxidase N-terminal domain-containing protein n=1 Tax=Aphanomyces euteiches TaxID=100861 RepID=A0A6G0XEN6_9STRA|nr:hypothetical protein Ae201684_005559 [Aphanomyces euteiches]KAH9150855.1 hypothetical protein AeRB84_006394 [Aphanomyces euteiches]